MKCVMIIDPSLPLGLQVNTAAGLGVSLAGKVGGLVGNPVADADSNVYQGIVNIPLPILSLSADELKKKCLEIAAKGDESLEVFIFSDVAQRSLSYDDYERNMANTRFQDMSILGICLYGPDKSVNKLSGNLKMLR